MAQVHPPSTTLLSLRGDADGHYRILVLGKTPSEKVRRLLSRTLNLSWDVVIVFEEKDRQAFVTGSFPGGVLARR